VLNKTVLGRLDSAGTVAEHLESVLQRRSDGELKISAEALRFCLEPRGREYRPCLRNDHERFPEEMAEMNPRPPESIFAVTPTRATA
jgi:hypothetical protein